MDQNQNKKTGDLETNPCSEPVTRSLDMQVHEVVEHVLDDMKERDAAPRDDKDSGFSLLGLIGLQVG